ncbi:MAG: 30S ribosomal protein S6 [Nitrospina sp.]|nr:30S ribosomal protein S6 [Nitrospina sp.]
MKSYQSVLILKADLDDAQVDQVIEKITEFLSKNNGSLLKVDKWGKKRLGYRIKKSRFGYYLNIYHTCESLKVSALEADYKLYDLILKFLVIKLSDKELEQEMKSDEIDNAVEETKEKTPATKSESDNGVEEVKEKN